MELTTLVYATVVSICFIALIISFIVTFFKASSNNKQPSCKPTASFRSVMGINVNYREEENVLIKSGATPPKLLQYNEDAANEVATVFTMALIKWIISSSRREVSAGYCEADWRKRTWIEQLKDVGLPFELYEDVIDNDYRFIKSFKGSLEQFLTAVSVPSSTEKQFMDYRKDEFKRWVNVKGNFVASNVDKYMTALVGFGSVPKNKSMDITSYGEVSIVQQKCDCPSLQPSSAEYSLQDQTSPIPFTPYSWQQRIAFIILVVVVIMCIYALLLAMMKKEQTF
jgi:hypothetical protein